MLRVGVDVGGTFTDLVAVDDAGRVSLAKSASTPADPSIGVMDGLALLAAELGTDLAGLLADTGLIVHGTTVATNALLERKGAKVGMLTTAGHRDVIEMREGLKDDRYNLRMAPPIPLVPRARRLDVTERMRFDGSVETPLSKTSAEAAIRRLGAAGVGAVAVCYLHSYRDPRHERETRKLLARLLPDAYVSLSSEVLAQIKEYERFCTTVVNAYVGPVLGRYLGNLGSRLRKAGYPGDVLIMQSHGGVATIADSVRLAAGAVLSGPAGGIAGSRHASRLLGEGNLITFDMGGTSTDIALLEGGEPHLTGDKAVGSSKVALPSIDIHTLGAGGGSIARVDAGGILHVGPESAGAVPGPACYGRGGTAATVTDANLVLGLLDPAGFLGGRARLDPAAAQTAVEGVAARLGLGPAAGGGRHPPRGQYQHGGGHSPGLGAAGRRPAALRAALVRRRGGPSHHRGRAHARDHPRGGAARGLGALGLGHAGHRPALRVRAHARGRGRPGRRGAPAQALRRDGVGGTAAPGRLVRGPGGRAPLGGHALRRADLRDPGAARRGGRGGEATSWSRWSSASTSATRSSTPTARPGRTWCWSTCGPP